LQDALKDSSKEPLAASLPHGKQLQINLFLEEAKLEAYQADIGFGVDAS
jgi:hypothetical protein